MRGLTWPMTSSRRCASPCRTLRMDSKEVGKIVQVEASSIGKIEESTEEVAVLSGQSRPRTAVPRRCRSMWSRCNTLVHSQHGLPVWLTIAFLKYSSCRRSVTSLVTSALGGTCAIGAWSTSSVSGEEV